MDRTPFFQQCLDIVQDIQHKEKLVVNKKSVINDTFIKECTDLYIILIELNQFITNIRLSYLDNDTSLDKSLIDEDINKKVHQLYSKLKFLDSYESKRQKVKQKNWITKFLESDDLTDSINLHRTNILRFLQTTLNNFSKSFESMHRKRLKRDLTFAKLDFRNLDTDYEIEMGNLQELNENDLNDSALNRGVNKRRDFDQDGDLNKGRTFNEDGDFGQDREFNEKGGFNGAFNENGDFHDSASSGDFNSPPSPVLSQVQIQEYEEENKQLLNMKSKQLHQVEKLKDSMLDIMNLQADLSFQLETQGDQIDNLLNNQSQVEVDVKLGNKSLNKATRRNKKGADMLVFLCVLFGFLLLIVDWISW